MPGSPFPEIPAAGTPERALFDEWSHRPAFGSDDTDIRERLAELALAREQAEQQVAIGQAAAAAEVEDTPVEESDIEKCFTYRNHSVSAHRDPFRRGDITEEWVVRVPESVRVYAAVAGEAMRVSTADLFRVCGNLARLSYDAEQHRLKGIDAGRTALALFMPEGWLDEATAGGVRRRG